jgi:cytochrome P450
MFPSVFSLESVSTFIGIVLLSIYYIFFRETRNSPPRTKHNLVQLIRVLTGGNAPDFYLQCMKNHGPVYILPLPQPFVVVCDPNLAKTILKEENEKTSVYKQIDGLTLGLSTIFSKSTYGSNHHKIRKCLAPSFSSANIISSLPKLHEKIDLLKKIFFQNEKDDASFNVAEIWICFVQPCLMSIITPLMSIMERASSL